MGGSTVVRLRETRGTACGFHFAGVAMEAYEPRILGPVTLFPSNNHRSE